MTAREILSAISSYPFPVDFIESIGKEVGLELDYNIEDIPAKALNGAKARLYLFLATAPNVSEGGVSISYTSTERSYFMNLARRFAALAGDANLVPGTAFGYKGQDI